MVEYNVIKEAMADLLMIQRTEDTSKFDVEDLTIKVNDDSSQSIVVSDKTLREAYDKVSKMRNNFFFMSTSHYAEIAVQPEGRFSRHHEEIEVSDSVNGITYRISSASLEYCLYIISLICEDKEIDYQRTIQDFKMSYRLAIRRTAYDNEITFEKILSNTLRLTSLKMQFDNETTVPQMKKHASAFEYLFMYKRGYALFEVSDISTLLRMEGGGRSRVSVIDEAPRRSVNPEVLEFYSMALAAEDPFTIYISFYHIIEYYFDEIYQKKLVDDMKEKITSPDFSYKDDKKLLELASFVSKRMKSDDEAGKGNELESLKYVLATFAPIEELKNKLNEINPTLVQFYSDKSVSFAGKQQLKIAWNDMEGVYSSLAKRIYAIRNALVHSKSGQNDKLYKPLKHKAILYKELPLIRVVAELIITKSGEVI